MHKTLARIVLALLATTSSAQPNTDTSPVPQAERSLPSLPVHWQHGVFMEIFVRAWKDSNGDGVGDLRGLIQTLPYLQDLGIRGIWLMPITTNADGDHGYATTDFRAIAPEYGTLADFDELMLQARKRGIGVIMDYVINHSAASHPMFEQARQGPGSPYRDWFVWSEEAPQGWDIWGKDPWYHTASQPWLYKGDVKEMPRPGSDARGFYFGTFGPHMPDFNFHNPQVMAYHLSSLRFWLNRGLAGYRLDAVPHLIEGNAKDWNDQPQSRALTKQLQDSIKAYPQRYVVCEATANPQDYGDAAVCGGAFAFGQVHHYAQAALGQAESVQKVASYYMQARPTMASFVSNHDIFAGKRLWDQVQGQEARYKLAAAAYLLQPGTPFVYYGEEVGQSGVPTLKGDLPLRGPMSWNADAQTAGFTTGQPFRPPAPNVATHNAAAQQKDPRSIWHFYKTMIGLRNQHPSIARGSYEAASAQGLVAQWQRKLADGAVREHSLVLINYGDTAAPAQMQGLPAGARLVSAHPVGGATATKVDAQGRAELLLAPLSVRVLLVRSAADKAAPQGGAKKKPAKPRRKVRQ
jgi:alpha-amylase